MTEEMILNIEAQINEVFAANFPQEPGKPLPKDKDELMVSLLNAKLMLCMLRELNEIKLYISAMAVKPDGRKTD